MINKLFYVGLEKLQSRYTLQLTDWTKAAIQKYLDSDELKEFIEVPGQNIDDSQQIVTGQVLDAHGRGYYSLSQMMWLIEQMKKGNIRSNDVIFFEDMMTPGIESLFYILDQVPNSYKPKIFVRCLAQTIDPDDFVHSTGMVNWMAHYEKMVCSHVTAILASNEEMVANIVVAGWEVPIYNISGLSFGKDEVLSRVNNNVTSWHCRKFRVIFAARFDDEKQPNFFMDLIEKIKEHPDGKYIEFCIATGNAELKSNNQNYLDRVKKLEDEGKVSIHKNLSKNEYYELLNNSRILINTAMQDWTSNTVSEADTLGCNVLYPAYRSFPEIFSNCPDRLYIPWSLEDAEQKLLKLIKNPHSRMGEISDWTDKTIDRIFSIMNGEGEQWSRNDRKYRRHLSESKYISKS